MSDEGVHDRDAAPAAEDAETMNRLGALPAIVTTKRLVLRPLDIADAESFAQGATNPEVARMTGTFATPFLPHAAAFFILRQPSLERRGLGKHWAVTREDELIGCIGIFANDKGARWGASWEIGYWLKEEVWGCGYGTEALRAVVACLDGPVFAQVFADNPGSLWVLEKTGFSVVGEESGHCMERQGVVEGVVLRKG